jgi:hypothetical protein
MPDEQIKFEAKAEKWYESKIAFLIMLLVPIISVVWFLSGMETRIALDNQTIDGLKVQLQNLKDNDLHTIEQHQKEDDQKFSDLSNQITELKTILNERLPAKK